MARDGAKEPAAEIENIHGAFNVILIREAIALGQRIGGIAVDVRKSGEWKTVATATSVGACRIIRLDESHRVPVVRLRVTESAAPPANWTAADFGVSQRMSGQRTSQVSFRIMF